MHLSGTKLINELYKRSLAQEVLNVTCIIYLQYWLQPNVKLTFLGHLALLKTQHYHLRTSIETSVMCSFVLDGVALEQQASFFVGIRKNNCVVAMLPPFITT